MVKRIVDTKFWSNMDVLDNYSVEDKFFALYLMTNPESSQVGIYSLPKKIISFETGFTTEVIQVLLDRFSTKYGQILYSEQTQEISVLRSLEYSIVKGGKPVSDLLERELRAIQDGQLILVTYQMMQDFWQTSKRKFDHIIKEIFETELVNRELIVLENENENVNENENENVNGNVNDNDNDNDNDNEGSYSTNRSSKEKMNRSPKENLNRGTNRDTNHQVLINTDRLLPEEQVHLTKYLEFLRYQKPTFNRPVKTDEILYVFYEELLGELTSTVKEKIKVWDQQLPKSLILEAMVRSVDKFNPAAYINSIINNWLNEKVSTLRDVARLDREFNRENN